MIENRPKLHLYEHDLSLSFVVDRTDVTYMAVSSNVAIRGSRGGPEKYEILMRYAKPPTEEEFDYMSTLTASESYVGNVLYRCV